MKEKEIDCTACGNCCADRCDRKKGNLCIVHPSIVGEGEAAEKRGFLCDWTAIGLFSQGYYCPPVIEIFEQETGRQLTPLLLEGDSQGLVLIAEMTSKEWDGEIAWACGKFARCLLGNPSPKTKSIQG